MENLVSRKTTSIPFICYFSTESGTVSNSLQLAILALNEILECGTVEEITDTYLSLTNTVHIYKVKINRLFIISMAFAICLTM